MDKTTFQAMVVSEEEEGRFRRSIETRSIEDLPHGALLIRVHYSSLNYKDALSASGNKGVTRHYPHTPGIDAAGVVAASDSDDFKEGDEVIVIGYDLGMDTDGGFGQYIRIPADWAVHRPQNLSLRESMIYGTAGFTAAMSADSLLQHGVTVEDGEILVTGASGGVGSLAVSLLAQWDYRVVAATGKARWHDTLRDLGAAEIVSREAITKGSERPLLHGRWAGVVDVVGGEMLSAAIKATRPAGAVTVCGNAASHELQTTVYPFILRGVTLYGINSANASLAYRRQLWQRLAEAWKPDALESLATERTLSELDAEIERILAGEQTGRVLVNLEAPS